ncbi:ParB N-terminal domain-containing protein [Streptomyces scabiei]|uniref:ParB N-terminal domain-containing protein n=1 Tax=Streptomyces scabiei TaxID=1930 RepID=UPI001B30CC6E|nr:MULTISPECIES: ParB N-terminal domain-containing protein [Streptomyces]MDX2749625.1 ParB N-terminal domain-containing protein [Streptomyces scabiei]MDX3146507.1 ParB N-terminal domain-containing protein [Streptomyces scabiei]MDX3196913.1 ParB N-terminal domain-containing protein [Streptomyces scabiei]
MGHRLYPDVDRALAQLERHHPRQVVTIHADTSALQAAFGQLRSIEPPASRLAYPLTFSAVGRTIAEASRSRAAAAGPRLEWPASPSSNQVTEKLIRDLIPALAAADGQHLTVRTVAAQEMPGLLRRKLVEESAEAAAADGQHLVEELADVLEVVRALAAVHDFEVADVERARVAKLSARGGFERGVVLEGAPTVVPAADRAALRNRIRRAIARQFLDETGSGRSVEELDDAEFGTLADAVLSVLPAPADRAPETPQPETRVELQVWPLQRVLTEVCCGSQDWTWEEEWADLARRHAETGYLDRLEEQIRANGITMPVLIGSDGRLWDGHHRLCIAVRLGIGYVPVEITQTASEEPGSGVLVQLTDAELHARFAHPAYEYRTTEGPRKQWDNAGVPPADDNGDPDPTWERNTDAGRDGWERWDHTEESYWRRPLPQEPGR